MVLKRFSFTCLVLFICSVALAEDSELTILALFKNAAMVEYDGTQKLYRVGQNIAPNIQLKNADSRTATFIIDGKEQILSLNNLSSINTKIIGAENGVASSAKTVSILRGGHGMYLSGGFINGVAVEFLVDTGASQVAMNENVAQQVGLLYRQFGEKIKVSTAAGNAYAWSMMLNKVRVGGIELDNVPGLVIEGAGPNEVLLGMSFLGRVTMKNEGQLLHLEQKY